MGESLVLVCLEWMRILVVVRRMNTAIAFSDFPKLLTRSRDWRGFAERNKHRGEIEKQRHEFATQHMANHLRGQAIIRQIADLLCYVAKS